MFGRNREIGEPGSRWPSWIDRQLLRRGIDDERVLQAFARVPREAFIPRRYRLLAHDDGPLGIGCGQTISQPYVVGLSLQALRLRGTERVLDVGTGSGYQTALLSCLAAEVYTIEAYQRLYINARAPIERWSRAPVHMRHGDGSLGWPEAAPFDGIVVGARAPRVPEALIEQLAPGGRLVVPVGGEAGQGLYRFTLRADGTLDKALLERVVFVPLVGKGGTGRLPVE